MAEFGKRVDQPGGRRRSRRQRVVLTAAAVNNETSQPVIIEDVCSTGAKLRGRDLPEAGRSMTVAVGTMTLDADVAWSLDEQCGITFKTSLDDFGVRRLKHEGSWGRVISII